MDQSQEASQALADLREAVQLFDTAVYCNEEVAIEAATQMSAAARRVLDLLSSRGPARG